MIERGEKIALYWIRESNCKFLTITRQTQLLQVARSSYYYKTFMDKEKLQREKEVMSIINTVYMTYPFLGSRRIQISLKQQWYALGRYKVMWLMRYLWIKAITPKRRTTIPNPEHTKYPYLLRDVEVEKVNHVWSTDITYIKMRSWFVYLAVILDWYSRKILSWKISTTMDVWFCLEVLREAIQKHGTPEIFNSDQWSQFTSREFIKILEDNGILISMDGKWRYVDNIYSERLWRTIKQEEVYLKQYTTPLEAIQSMEQYVNYYNEKRPHQSLNYLTPNQVYYGAKLPTKS